MVLVCLFVYETIAFAIEPKNPAATSTLAPSSIFKPAVVAKWNTPAKKYEIVEDKQERSKFQNGRQEDAAFVYLNLLIGQFANDLAELKKLGVSGRGSE